MWKTDRFSMSIPEEFDQTAKNLWENARYLAAELGSFSDVFADHYFLAWLEWVGTGPMGLTASDFRSMLGKPRLRAAIQSAPAKPDFVLSQMFCSALIDSYRFTGNLTDVDYRWIIPNLLDVTFFLGQRLRKSGIVMDLFLRSMLEMFGEPFRDLVGHYKIRCRFHLILDSLAEVLDPTRWQKVPSDLKYDRL